MINLKMSELLNATETLQKLSQKELKARLALQIARMLKEGEREMQNFNEVRTNLIRKYGEKDDNGELVTDENGNCKILQGQTETFSKELNDLIGMEIEINANKIKLADMENLNFTPADMSVLEPFMELEDE